MAKQASTRCGKGNCPYRDPLNDISKCSLYTDRKLCSKSMKQRKRTAANARKRPEQLW